MTLRFPSQPPSSGPFLDGADSLKNDIFISHAVPDAGAAETIAAALGASKLRCFMTHRDIPAGMDRAAAIIDAIWETKLFLLLHSAHANSSLQMARELQLVQDRHIGVLAARLDDSIAAPKIEFVLKRQTVFHAVPLGQRLAALVDAVHARLGDRPQCH